MTKHGSLTKLMPSRGTLDAVARVMNEQSENNPEIYNKNRNETKLPGIEEAKIRKSNEFGKRSSSVKGLLISNEIKKMEKQKIPAKIMLRSMIKAGEVPFKRENNKKINIISNIS